MKFVDYYKMLGVSRYATTEEIRKKYRVLAQQYHSDKLNNKLKRGEITEEELNNLNEYFKELTAAYNVLINSDERIEYDKTYDEHKRLEEERKQQAEERRKKYEEARKRKEAEEAKRKEENNDTEYYEVKPKESVFKDIKDSYREIKREERRQPSFIKRHHIVDESFYDEYYFENMDKFENVIFQTGRGILHVSIEFLYNINKLKYITKDSIPKYIIRNRRLAALVVAGVITVNGIGMINNDNNIDESSASASTEVTEETDETVTLTRYYTIKNGDTLSQIALDSGTTQAEIQKINGINEASYIMIGSEIKVPYTIDMNDISYCTDSVQYDNKKSLKEFASEYETDIESLKRINEEAIIADDGVYLVLSDSLNVPNFISKEELNKKQERQY